MSLAEVMPVVPLSVSTVPVPKATVGVAVPPRLLLNVMLPLLIVGV